MGLFGNKTDVVELVGGPCDGCCVETDSQTFRCDAKTRYRCPSFRNVNFVATYVRRPGGEPTPLGVAPFDFYRWEDVRKCRK